MTMKVLVLNGPNLGRLGSRQPDVYGALTYERLAEHLVETGKPLGFDVDVRQTEHEGQMIEWLHEAADGGHPVVINAGAWTHYSYAIADAAALVSRYVEVHISNVFAREEFRHHSVLSAGAAGVIVGCGVGGYDLALAHLASLA
ncbi:type II 3-dehydroquinate dehydratase [uncultured Tessaracoccus sp.]|uniref:type II 3-dehydroquinate dehydratase n=1 Tax=uncultured Tessaracoccus sp. TaxID=905023 RepID=UPI002628DDA9|nr:type II 3-dehydroquinate dehydratase [uncultured Tessaracoccus sp.]